MPLTQQELESRLWDAANSLRGPVDPGDFKTYIFPLLFFKRISDAWDDEHARAVEDFGDDLTPEIEADYHRFQLPDGCHWLDLRKVHENVGVGLQNILDRIQQANPDTLGGIFGDVQWANKDEAARARPAQPHPVLPHARLEALERRPRRARQRLRVPAEAVRR